MPRIKIVNCTDPMLWYAHHVGTTWKLVREDDSDYWVRDLDCCLNIVHKKDAEIVTEKET